MEKKGAGSELGYISDNSTVGTWVDSEGAGTCAGISHTGGISLTDCIEGEVSVDDVSLVKQPLCEFGNNGRFV